MFERYSERARRAIFFSREEALHRNAKAIETSDLVLAIFRETPAPDSPLTPLHERVEEIRTSLAAKTYSPDSRNLIDIPLTTMSKEALAYAAEEADRDATRIITPEHLLRGVLRADDNAANIVAQSGVTLKSMRAAANSARKANPLPPLPLRWRLKIHRLRIILAVGIAALLSALLYMHFQR
jgi:ATP-dependent Clp protease ATP-binding subunit ClpC